MLRICKPVSQPEKPDHIVWDEWEKLKIRKPDVEKHLKSALRKQNPTKSKANRVIKNNYSFELDGEVLDINQAVLSNEVSTRTFDTKWMARLIEKKSQEYNTQNVSFEEMHPDREIAAWLDNFELSDDEETIHLNDAQKRDINLFCRRDIVLFSGSKDLEKHLLESQSENIDLKRNKLKTCLLLVQQLQSRTIGMMY